MCFVSIRLHVDRDTLICGSCSLCEWNIIDKWDLCFFFVCRENPVLDSIYGVILPCWHTGGCVGKLNNCRRSFAVQRLCVCGCTGQVHHGITVLGFHHLIYLLSHGMQAR